jgi:hypothetical protein
VKIVETITPVNAEKTFLGKKELSLTLDTETGRVALDTPAMFTDPVVTLEDLQGAVKKLEEYKELADRDR